MIAPFYGEVFEARGKKSGKDHARTRKIVIYPEGKDSIANVDKQSLKEATVFMAKNTKHRRSCE